MEHGEQADSEAVEVENTATDTLVDLPPSRALTVEDAAEIMGHSVTRLVVLGGPQDSGKTTLIASLYERFQRGPFAGLRLGWSSTLLGLEQICHDGRECSRRANPTTPHTSRQLGRQLYHFRLDEVPSSSRQDIILTDMSGEEFEDLRKYTDTMNSLNIIRRADHFVAMMDGERLVRPDQRHQVVDETVTTLRVLVESGFITRGTHVGVVVSKWDLLQGSDPQLKCEEHVTSIESEVRAQFDSTFASLGFFRIAARDPTGATGLASGAEKLIQDWVSLRRIILPCSLPRKETAIRPYDTFTSSSY